MADPNPLPPPRPLATPTAGTAVGARPAAWPTPTLDTTTRAWLIIGAICGGLILVGSLGPWAQVSSAFGTASVNGTSGDGKLTLITGGLVLAGFLSSVWVLRWIGGGIGLAIGVYDWSQASSKFDDVNSTGFVHASVGWGLWLVIAASAVALVASALASRSARLL